MFGPRKPPEEGWLAEVCHSPSPTTGGGGECRRWKSLEEWTDRYEPQNRPTEAGGKTGGKGPNALERKLHRAILDAVHSGLVGKMLVLVRETASQILERAESDLRRDAHSAPPAAESAKVASEGGGEEAGGAGSPEGLDLVKEEPGVGASPEDQPLDLFSSDEEVREFSLRTARLLNAANAIILTYRFDSSDGDKRIKKKFAYLRRAASDDVADVLWEALSSVSDSDKRSMEMHRQIRSSLERLKEEAAEIVAAQLDIILEDFAERLEERAAELEKDAESVLSDLGATGEVILDAYGAKKNVPDSGLTAQKQEEIREQLAERREDVREWMLSALRSLVKTFVMGKMNKLTAGMIVLLDGLLDLANRAYEEGKAREEAGMEKLREEMFQTVEGVHSNLESRVSTEVRKMVIMLGAALDMAHGDEES